MCNKMSDVRLSNASPTLRVDARQPDTVRPRVCRNLFGSPDPEEIRRHLTESIQEGVETFREEFNFDPVTERPLSPRNYDWVEDRDAPEFYSRPPPGSQRPRGDVDSAADNSRQGAEGSSGGGPSARQPDTSGSRKRRSGALGPCSSESRSKRSHTDGEDDDHDDDGAAAPAVGAAQEAPSRPESIAEVQ